MTRGNSEIARLRHEKTFPVSNFDPEKKQKTLAGLRGQKVTIANVHGQGTIGQLGRTFPGWTTG